MGDSAGNQTGFVWDGTRFVSVLPPPFYQTPPFNALNFFANGAMTWTVALGDVALNRFMLVSGKTLIWGLNVAATIVGGVANTQLLARIPANFLAAGAWHDVCHVDVGGVGAEVCHVATTAGGGAVILERISGANFPAAGGYHVAFSLAFEVL